MPIGTAIILIFTVWLLITHPRAILRLVAGLIGIVALAGVMFYLWNEQDRPRREREAAERRRREDAMMARIRAEEATLLRDRDTYRSSSRWIGVAVDKNHCRYYVDLETMTIGFGGISVWIKAEKPFIEPDLYLSETCYELDTPFQVSFGCTGRQVSGAWSFGPGMVSEGVLAWIQKSPWCAKLVADAKAAAERRERAAQEQREKARADSQAKPRVLERYPSGLRLERDADGILHFRR